MIRHIAILITTAEERLGQISRQHMLTPDGTTMYLVSRDEIYWRVINANNGTILATIDTEKETLHDRAHLPAQGRITPG